VNAEPPNPDKGPGIPTGRDPKGATHERNPTLFPPPPEGDAEARGLRHRAPRVFVVVAAGLSIGAVLAGLALSGFFQTAGRPVSPPGAEGAEPLCRSGRSCGEVPTSVPQRTYSLTYDLAATYATGLTVLRGIAVDSADRIYVAGDSQVKVLDRDGRPVRSWTTSAPARSVAVGQSGSVYVALLTKVEKHDAAGRLLTSWGTKGKEPGQFAHLTAITAAEPNVYVADAGNRCIHRFASDGDFIRDIGRRDPTAGVLGFIVPSPYLDCAVDAEGILYVGHTGRWRVERYTPDDRLLGWWGSSGMRPEDFCGCCNPTNVAVTPDGRVVTSEKGIRRVKVYDSTGRLLALMGVNVFARAADGTHGPGLDLAVDSTGRILVTDPAERAVRVFAEE